MQKRDIDPLVLVGLRMNVNNDVRAQYSTRTNSAGHTELHLLLSVKASMLPMQQQIQHVLLNKIQLEVDYSIQFEDTFSYFCTICKTKVSYKHPAVVN